MQRDASTAPAWQALKTFAAATQPTHCASCLPRIPGAARAAWSTAAGLTLDFSRQRVSAEVLACLTQLADEIGLRERIAGMYRGDIANPTENRQVLHTALRRSGAPHASEVHGERERMLGFAEAVRNGDVRGSDGERFELVVNIGIGGSDLGPAMAVQALRPFTAGAPRMAFVSNVDGSRLADTLAGANPRRTLFIVCSKTFTTLETRTNAERAQALAGRAARHAGRAGALRGRVHQYRRRWMRSASIRTTASTMWDWVGGRYSIWSSIGVSLAIAIGARALPRVPGRRGARWTSISWPRRGKRTCRH